MSGTAPGSQDSDDSPAVFGNIAQKVPHYMFVTYQAHVCQECVDSDKKMHKLQHGGEEWRYDYKDPSEERELDSGDVDNVGDNGETTRTRKTGRREFGDKVSLIPGGLGGSGGQPCQCDECLKNRETVRYAAENGLIEQIFGGARHPLSETIETITYTTIVRAPIIEETIETVWCEEPNCQQCLAKDEAYRNEQYRELAGEYPGMVIHETDGSIPYEERFGAKDLWGLRSDDDDGGSVSGRGKGLSTLLERAGNPRQEGIRGLQTSTRGEELQGEQGLIGFDRNDRVEAGEECPICAEGGSMMSHHGVQDALHHHRNGPITKEDILEQYKSADRQ